MITRHRVSAAPPPPAGVKYHTRRKRMAGSMLPASFRPIPRSPSAPFPDGIAAQAEQTFENLKTIVEAAGFALSDTVFARIYLTHFERDFDGFNVVYHRYFADDDTGPFTHDHRGRQARQGRAR